MTGNYVNWPDSVLGMFAMTSSDYQRHVYPSVNLCVATFNKRITKQIFMKFVLGSRIWEIPRSNLGRVLTTSLSIFGVFFVPQDKFWDGIPN